MPIKQIMLNFRRPFIFIIPLLSGVCYPGIASKSQDEGSSSNSTRIALAYPAGYYEVLDMEDKQVDDQISHSGNHPCEPQVRILEAVLPTDILNDTSLVSKSVAENVSSKPRKIQKIDINSFRDLNSFLRTEADGGQLAPRRPKQVRLMIELSNDIAD